MTLSNFEVTDDTVSGFKLIKITEGEFEGAVYTYGSVKLEEKEDELTVSFEYVIRGGDVKNIEGFEKLIGEILNDILVKGLTEESIIYHGGV